MCSLWCVQMIGCIMVSGSFFIMQTNLKALDFLNGCQVYAVECVTKIKYIP